MNHAQTEPTAPSPSIDGVVPAPPRAPATRLILIRHGESTWNKERRIQGQLDPPLSDLGTTQARLVARRLASRHVDAMYTSDLQRARQTAAPIAEALGLSATPMSELREIYLGEWEGLHADDIAQRFPEAWDEWTREPSWDVVPGGEGAAAFEARVESALHDLFERHAGNDVVIVTHGGVIQVALHHVVGRSSHGLFAFRISNGSMSVVEERAGRLVIGRVNDTSHLEVAESTV